MKQFPNYLPSDMLNIKDEYLAFCFNEACAVIFDKIKNGSEPKFHKKYGSLSDFYKDIGF